MSPKWKFILKHGLGWGLFMYLGITVWKVYIEHYQFTWIDAALTPIWLGAGLLFGSAMWRFERYRKT